MYTFWLCALLLVFRYIPQQMQAGTDARMTCDTYKFPLMLASTLGHIVCISLYISPSTWCMYTFWLCVFLFVFPCIPQQMQASMDARMNWWLYSWQLILVSISALNGDNNLKCWGNVYKWQQTSSDMDTRMSWWLNSWQLILVSISAQLGQYTLCALIPK